MTMLALSLLALGLGPVLHYSARAREWLRFALDGFVLVAVGGLVLVDILPHTVESAGYWSLLVVLFGMLLPLVLERRLTTLAPQAHAAALFVGLFGLVLHNAIDGIGLAPSDEGHPDAALSWAIVLHQIPVGLMVWWLLKPSFGRLVAIATLLALSVATVAGYFFGAHMQESIEGRGFALVQALVAGSLLHVIAHRSHAQVGHHGPTMTFPAGVGAIAGLVLLLLLDAHDGAHSHGDHGDHGAGFAEAFVRLALDSAPALVLAYLLAGLIQAFLPQASVRWMAKGGRLAQSLRGVAFGLPLPVCSCGVVPIYRSLMRQGVPAAAAIAFLVATPELGVDAVLVSLGLLGRDMAIARIVAAAVVAIVLGYALSPFAKQERDVATDSTPAAGSNRNGSIVAAIRSGTIELVDSTGPWIVFGIVIAAVLEPTLDLDFLASIPPMLQVPVFALVGMPMYVCASGATPLVAVLLAKGATPGAAIAFLLTGPATNVTTFSMLSHFHGRRFAIYFATGMILLTVLLGIGVNAVGLELPDFQSAEHQHHHGSWLQFGAAAILGGLLLWSVLRQGPRGFIGQIFSLTRLEGEGAAGGSHGHHHGHDHRHEDHGCCSHGGTH